MSDQRGKLAFEILARENSRMLMAYLRALVKDQAAVDDLFQESMLVAWRRLDECDLSRPFGPWLRGIASKLVLAYYRKAKANPIPLNAAVLDHVDRKFESISGVPGDTWDEKVAAIHACLEALPKTHRDAIQGRYFDGVKGAAVAEQLGVSYEAFKKRLLRARRMLAECLGRKGVFSTEGTS